MTTPTSHAALDAPRLHDAFRIAERWLDGNRDRLNAINVYPVPDGDTGTNMLLTLRAALEATERAPATDCASWARQLARGALLGARGNSGVILSQWLRGLSEALQDAAPTVTAPTLAAALEHAAWVAYGAVSEPVEGTMLTVMRDAAQAAAAAAAGGADLLAVLVATEREADRSVERTPDLLPRLREAGVVDAGGAGMAVVLAGLRLAVAGEPLPPPPAATAAVALDAVEHEGHGYCIEFVLEAANLDRDAITAALQRAGGESALVVGDASALHVHVHMADPGPALSAGAAAGALSAVKVDNMQAQHERWAAEHRAARAPSALGLVAVAPGPGIAAAFRALGAVVVDSADVKPSADQLLAAARSTGSAHVLLLPNDKDVRLAAEQAAAEVPGLITVLPTRSYVAGLSAAVEYTPDGDPAVGAARLRTAAARVRCIEVTRAARTARIDGVAVQAGDAIALVDGVLVATGGDPEGALAAGLAHTITAATELVTVYLGVQAPPDARTRVAALLADAHPTLALEIIDGGQPHYPYAAGVE